VPKKTKTVFRGISFPKELQVLYSDGWDDAFEEKIVSFIETMGYHRWAEGYDIEAHKREICFDRKMKKRKRRSAS